MADANNNYFDRYRPIRNALRKYSPASVLRECLAYLYRPTRTRVEQAQKLPWLVLLLIKWTFVDEESERPGRPDIPASKLGQLLNMVHDMADSVSLPSMYQGVGLFMRAVAFQQFIYQRQLSFSGLSRQEVLFAQAPANSFIRTRFLQETGVDIPTFLRLYLAVLVKFTLDPNDPRVDGKWFEGMVGTFGRAQVDAFLRAASTDLAQLPKWLRAQDSGRRPSEYNEQTPFQKRPLVRSPDGYVCVHPAIAQRAGEHFVYDLLKAADETRFNSAFSPRFEAYVGSVLKDTGLPMVAESEILRELAGEGEVIDYLLCDGDVNIFVDAKGVEMAARAKAALSQEVVKGATKTSLLKAVSQAHAVNARLIANAKEHSILRARPNNFVLAITYKELHIANGRALSESAGREAIEAIYADYPAEQRISLENMYFLTIEELEMLVSYVKAGAVGLASALEKARAADAGGPGTRKFIFAMHFETFGPPPSEPPTQLKKAQEQLTADLEKALS